MKTLLILRHAKSSWKDAELEDHDRPLNKRGEHDAPRMGHLLREEDLVPDLILSSTAKRARKTAEAVAEASGYTGEVELIPELYGGGPEAYLETLHNLPGENLRVLVVGHNPDLEELVEMLTGKRSACPPRRWRKSPSIENWQALDAECRGDR
jgi:phosphohistidine phosphatase